MSGASYTFALEDGGQRVGALTVEGEDNEQEARVQARQILGVRQLHGSPSVGPLEPDWRALAEEGFPVHLHQQDADHLLAAVEWALAQPNLDLGPGLRRDLVEEAGRRIERVFEMLRRFGVPEADNIGTDTRLAIEMRALESLADEHDEFLALAGELASALTPVHRELADGAYEGNGRFMLRLEEAESDAIIDALARYHAATERS